MSNPWEDFQTPAPTSASEGNPWEDFQGPVVAPKKGKRKPYGPDIEATAASVIPGVVPSSGYRTPAHNRKVGGKENSFHLTNDARDFVPPPGMSMSELAGSLRPRFKGFDVINEGDHVHIEPGPGGGTPLEVPQGIAGIKQAAPAADTPSENPWEDFQEPAPQPRRNERGSMQEESIDDEFKGLDRTDRMVIGDQSAKNNDYVESFLASAKADGVSFTDVEKDLSGKFGKEWYGRNKASIRHYYDTGGPLRWVANPNDPSLNENVGPDIVVEGGKAPTDAEMKQQYLSDRAEEGYRHGMFGLYNLATNLVGQDDATKEELIYQEKLARAELESRLENNYVGNQGRIDDEIAGFGADLVGGLGPDALLPAAVGKTPLTRALSAPVLAAGVDAALQKGEQGLGLQDEFSYSRNLLAAGTGGALQGAGEVVAHGLTTKYSDEGFAVATFDNPRVIEVSDGPINTNPTNIKMGKGPGGVVKRRVADEIAEASNGWTNSPEIVVHSSRKAFSKAEPNLFGKMRADNATSAPGFYAEDGRIHVIAENVKGEGKAKSLIFHEALGHYGMAQKFGDDLDVVLDDFYKTNWRLRAEANALGKGKYGEVYTGADRNARLVEEVLAKRSEAGALPKGILDKVLPVLRKYGKSFGMDVFSGSEIKAILNDVHQKVISGEKEAAPRTSGLRYVLTTHVSPHNFSNVDPENPYGAFDHSKMGSGEGAQVYGWGTYLGENTKDVYHSKFSMDTGSGALIDTKPLADGLREHFSKDFSSDAGRESNAIHQIEEDMSYFKREGNKDYKDVQDYIRSRVNAYETERAALSDQPLPFKNPNTKDRLIDLDYILDGYSNMNGNYIHFDDAAGPHTYEVDVPQAIQDRMLLWDKPFDEQPQVVRDAADELGIKSISKGELDELRGRAADASDAVSFFYEDNIHPWNMRASEHGKGTFEAEYARLKAERPGIPERTLENWAADAEVNGIAQWKKENPLPAEIQKESKRLGKIEDELLSKIENAKSLDGEDFYAEVVKKKGSPKAASEYLAEKGIPGNKYEDGFSRGKYGDKSYNYVMYNDKGPDAPKIINKYMLDDDALPEKTVKKLLQSMKGARFLAGENAARVAADRAEKIKAVKKARGNTSGEKGLYAELSALKGETQKAQIEPFRDKFSKAETKALFDVFKNTSKLTWFEGIRARQALLKLFEGEVPTRGELDLMGKVLPPEFIKYALDLRTKKVKLKDAFIEGTNFSRSMMSSIDFSAPFRQGIFLVNRKEFWKALPGMLKHFRSQEWHDAQMASIKDSPRYDQMHTAELDLTDLGIDYNKREESFGSIYADKVPGVKASGRAFTGFLNKLRADVFTSIVDGWEKRGVAVDDKMLKSLGEYINDATGRGTMPEFMEKHAPVFNGLFFSPKLIASRVNLALNPVYYKRMHPLVRRQAARDWVGNLIIASTVLGLAEMKGADVEYDPRSSDFLKIRFGTQRYDITGGFGQYFTLMSRISPEILGGNQTKTLKGQLKKLGSWGTGTRGDVVMKFTRNKLAPVPAYITDLMQGENTIGEPFSPMKDTLGLVSPLLIQDMWEGYEKEGATGMLKKTPSIVGIGSSDIDAVPLKYDALGRDVESASDDDPVSVELDRLSELTGKDEPLILQVDKKNLPKGPIRDAAKQEDIDKFQKLSGDYIYEDLRAEMNSPEWQEMSDEEKIELVNEIKKDQRANAREDLWPATEEE